MAKKRSNGEGSVYRRKDGSWVGQYKVLTSNGAKRRYIYANTRKDAATRLAQAVAERDSGLVYDCGSMTLEDYLSKWLVTTKGTVRERTWIRSALCKQREWVELQNPFIDAQHHDTIGD